MDTLLVGALVFYVGMALVIFGGSLLADKKKVTNRKYWIIYVLGLAFFAAIWPILMAAMIVGRLAKNEQ